MLDATVSVDPTLATLIPQRSVRRNLTLSVIVVLLFAGVWASPSVLRPSVDSDASAGAWWALAPHHQVFAALRLEPDGWPNVDIQSVGNLPGAEVAGAWLLADALAEFDDRLDPSDYSSGLDYLRAAFPRRDLGPANQLPRSVDTGETTQLLILWDITDCSQLIELQQPVIEFRTVLGTTTHEPLDEIASPAFDLNTLTEAGICPTL